MKRVVVVIPVHKVDPSANELASLRQCYKILGKHPIRIVAPDSLDLQKYREVVPDCQVMFIAREWLSSVQQYNKLKISKYFYDLFRDYEYLLTYELDAWVFRDELLYWCDKGYDYIGAPWFEGYGEPGEKKEIIGVGNSGFSLRNVSSCQKIWQRLERLKSIDETWKRIFFSRYIITKTVVRFLNSYFHFNLSKPVSGVFIDHFEGIKDDGFWAEHVQSHFLDFKVASPECGMRFSFEVGSTLLYKMTKGSLPFGCHAWEKYEPEFWKQFIPIQG